MKSSNDKVNNFLSDIQATFPDNYNTVEKIREIFLEQNDDVSEEIKYGGIAFNNNENKLVGGIYIYKAHISIEFSHGAGFTDPDKLLEGKGKFRRHLKILTEDDIVAKNISYYISQAL